MLVWIQKHDYSYDESHVDSAAEAIEKFVGFDWAQEIIQIKESEGEDCPPGFGVVSEDGKILHIVPDAEGECMVHFHYPEKKRFLLIFSGTVRSTQTREHVSLEESVKYIERFFQGNLDKYKFEI